MSDYPILVIGGGISGITAAVEIAEVGRRVVLIERMPYLGGNVVKMNNYFPKLCPPGCGLEINFRRIKQNNNITVYTSTVVESISGTKGNFIIQAKSKAEYINSNCTGCGECTEVCPEERPNEFNYFFDKTKAIYISHEFAFPFKYNIDDMFCIKQKCNRCVDICKYNAIDLTAGEKKFKLMASSIIIAAGWEPYQAGLIKDLHYSEYENIITNVELERLLAENGPDKGKLLRPSDNESPKSIAFAQCAGSRDENHLQYCSAVCCSASLKHALTISEKYPDIKINIFYIDIRVSGRNEDFLSRVEEYENIKLIKGKVAKIEEAGNSKNLILEAEDILSCRKVKKEFDLVVLAGGIRPSGTPVQNNLKDNTGFILPESLPEGIYATGCSKRPMDVTSSLKDATGMALKAIQ
ncbi:MAG: CoB--CoM heterodisulfide reductase iron-sulfur subunit A family protein [Bacteroidales bacterium]|nr:MAG: CoB--CoM heterodisulfide reductase iron-sulfur subunit A family protein [Bacteroidales bacterium]